MTYPKITELFSSWQIEGRTNENSVNRKCRKERTTFAQTMQQFVSIILIDNKIEKKKTKAKPKWNKYSNRETDNKSGIYNHMIRIFKVLTFQARRLKFACLLLIMFCCLRPAKIRQFPSNIGFSEMGQNRCCFSNIL